LTAIFVALCCAMMIGGLAFAQEKFPSKTITFVVPWAAGGGQDLAARYREVHGGLCPGCQ
jgi:tripartite-type tricarboxylate transporter receptor subunit TctC